MKCSNTATQSDNIGARHGDIGAQRGNIGARHGDIGAQRGNIGARRGVSGDCGIDIIPQICNRVTNN